MRISLYLFKRPIFTLLSVLLILTVIGVINITHQCNKLNCITFSDKSRYKLQEIYEDSKNQFRALYRYNDLLFRVNVHSNIQEPEAKLLIDGQIAQIKTQYADARAPYPGEITKTIVCEKHYLPSYRQESINGLSVAIVESFLTDRLTYGACTNEQAIYRSVLSQFYCPNTKQLYQLEFIARNDQFDSLSAKFSASIRSLHCKSRLP